MSIGQEHSMLLSNIALPVFDYVALGHIHKNQVLYENPPVVYAGSLERVDFGEENDEKGFYVVDIESDAADSKRRVSFKFHPVNTRRFLTINVAPEMDDLDPTATILRAIAAQDIQPTDAIVRLNIKIPEQMAGQLRDNEIRDALKDSHYVSVTRDVQRETRLRLGDRTAEEITPLEALKTWLESQDVPPERQKLLLEYGEKLIKGEQLSD